MRGLVDGGDEEDEDRVEESGALVRSLQHGRSRAAEREFERLSELEERRREDR